MRLETLTYSHYSERVRWCLDLIGEEYEEEHNVGILGLLLQVSRPLQHGQGRSGRDAALWLGLVAVAAEAESGSLHLARSAVRCVGCWVGDSQKRHAGPNQGPAEGDAVHGVDRRLSAPTKGATGVERAQS